MVIRPVQTTSSPSSGTKLSFGYFQLPTGEQQADVALVNTSSYTCTSTAPTLGPNSGSDTFGVLYGGPSPS